MSVVCLAWQGRVLKDDSKRINEYLIQNGQKVIVIIQKGTQAAQKYWNSLSSALSVSSPVGSGTLTYSGPTGLASQAILGHLTAAFQRAAQRTQDSSAMRGSSWIEVHREFNFLLITASLASSTNTQILRNAHKFSRTSI